MRVQIDIMFNSRAIGTNVALLEQIVGLRAELANILG